MTEDGVTPLPSDDATTGRLALLRQAGAPDLDSVGWRYIEILAAKVPTHQGAAQTLLHLKLDKALSDLNARMASSSQRSSATSTAPASDSPSLSSSPSLSPLAQLLQDLAPLGPPGASDAGTPRNPWHAENPRVRQFRQTLSQLNIQKQVIQAIAQAPQNAGPINSHMLVLRSLGRMRELSPDYLNRFMGYVDTLLSLEAAGRLKPLAKKSTLTSKSKK
jgi:hypothetical protein